MDKKIFRKAVNELLELIRRNVPSFVSPDPTAHLFAAAGLMRCYAGIRGIRVLSAKELRAIDDDGGRNLWEREPPFSLVGFHAATLQDAEEFADRLLREKGHVCDDSCCRRWSWVLLWCWIEHLNLKDCFTLRMQRVDFEA